MHKRLFLLCSLAIATTACSHVMSSRSHDDANTSRTRLSKAGTFQVSYQPAVSPVPKRELHAWMIDVRTRDGRPVDGATMSISGGMPDHGHGLPTQPVVQKTLGKGRYVVEGVKFNMGGYWVVDVGISSAEGHDDVRFELNL